MSTYAPMRLDSRGLDLTGRFVISTTVVGSPSAATETIIASVTIPDEVLVVSGIYVMGWCAVTVGTSGVSLQLKVRETSVSGTTVVDGGATAATAADKDTRSVFGFDTSGSAAMVYKLTLTVASGAAASTVSAVNLAALVV